MESVAVGPRACSPGLRCAALFVSCNTTSLSNDRRRSQCRVTAHFSAANNSQRKTRTAERGRERERERKRLLQLIDILHVVALKLTQNRNLVIIHSYFSLEQDTNRLKQNKTKIIVFFSFIILIAFYIFLLCFLTHARAGRMFNNNRGLYIKKLYHEYH